MTNEDFLARTYDVIVADHGAIETQIAKTLTDLAQLRQLEKLAAARAKEARQRASPKVRAKKKATEPVENGEVAPV